MLMDVAVWWDLNISLSEQETFPMFMDAAVGWVLDISLSEQQTCAIYILVMFIDTVVGSGGSLMSASLNNKHVLYMLIMFVDAAVGWVLDVSLSEQETCAIFFITSNVARAKHVSTYA
jgi:hypothetical protein